MRDFILNRHELFFTALLQVTFVAMSTVFITAHKIIPMLITGFIISFIWTLNVKKAAFGDMSDRLTYASGAMCGTGLGYFLSNYIVKLL